MANVQKRPNDKWCARYRDLDGKEHARHFDRKLDAQRRLDEVTAGVITGQYVDPRAGSITFAKYAERWQGSLIASEAGERITDNALRLHLVPALGVRSLVAIRRNDIQMLFKHLSDQLAPGSVRNVYDVPVRLMTAAVDDKGHRCQSVPPDHPSGHAGRGGQPAHRRAGRGDGACDAALHPRGRRRARWFRLAHR